MLSIVLRGLAGRKLRAALTALAVVLGVAMVSGTFVLTDTISRAFDRLFADSYAGTDAVISGKAAFETELTTGPSFDQKLLYRVLELPEVGAATGSIFDDAKLLDRQGRVIVTGGAPTFGIGVDPEQERFNPLELERGRWPSGSDEVAIDVATADGQGFRIGEEIGVAARGPVERLRIVGIARYGTVESIGGATFAVFDVPTAQRLFDKQRELDQILVAAASGTTRGELLQAVRQILPPATQIRTVESQASEDSEDTTQALGFIRTFLLAFGGIALFVGAFVIFNTLSITVAQRTREFATLRTIGASRRQLLTAVVAEGLAVGLIASLIGLVLGLALAKGLNALFVVAGIDLPQAGLVFAGRTVVVSLLIGVLVTLAASIAPALRATRVPPIAAVREGAVLPRSRLAPLLPAIAGLLIAASVAGLAYGMFVSNLAVTKRLILLGGGCLLLFVGVALISPHLVRPLASAVGWPAARFAGVAGLLARTNALRNPGRTAATAAALMIGLALVTFVGVLGQGLRSSVGDAIERQIDSDLVLSSQTGFTPFTPQAARTALGRPGVGGTSVRGDQGRAFGSVENVTGVDPQGVSGVYTFDWETGSTGSLRQLARDGAIVEDGFAEHHGLAVGDPLRLEAPSGRSASLTVSGIYSAPPFWQMLGSITVSIATFDTLFDNPRDLYAFLTASGTTDAAHGRIESALAGFPDVKVLTQSQFVTESERGVDILLNLLYVLLALSVVVSLFGMVNTLVLSVFERTRELGLLRAVGMTRRQVRRMVRHESVVTALIGTALGMPLGVFLAALVTRALEDEGLLFAVPLRSLVVFALVAVLAGLVAAVLPARRAARLNVLEALQYE